jgi:hypothetical protein
LKQVEIFTDGACSGNPGPGGWGAILRYGEIEKEMSGGEAGTTNNRMELLAAINALNALKGACEVESSHRQQICHGRHFQVDPRLEEERLEDGGEKAGEERRAVAGARCRRAAAQGQVALGQGPCRPSRERARR